MASTKDLPAKTIDEIKRMYSDGDRLADIARSVDLTPKALRSVIAELKLPSRQVRRTAPVHPRSSEVDSSSLLTAYGDAKVSIAEILDTFGIPLSRLYAELQKAGVERRRAPVATTASLGHEIRTSIVDAYNSSTATVREIASSHGLSYDQVYVVLREAAVVLKVDRNVRTLSRVEVREELKSLYPDSTVSLDAILKRLGISQHELRALVKELHLKPRGKGGGKRSISPEIIAQMPVYARRYEAGESMAKLAKEAGIGLATMKVRLKKLREK